jgi:hypothetical protein
MFSSRVSQVLQVSGDLSLQLIVNLAHNPLWIHCEGATYPRIDMVTDTAIVLQG